MGTFSIGGTAEQRSLARVNPKLVDVIRRAAESSPYNVQLFSGIRPGDSRYHGKGSAVDIVLSDPATGQEIPNLKSTVGFPIYEEFAKTARAVQQQTYPELSDTFRWGGYFGGGKGKYGSVDLMHFDLGPTAKMAGGSWETGLTPEQAKVIANLGPGQIYSGEGQRKAGPGEYANLWGRAPLQAPQDAQGAIASLIAPSGGAAIPDMPTAAMGYAPNLPGMEPPAPPMPQIASAAPPMPTLPPQWAQGGFPIDEALTGRSAQDVLMGGPRSDPRRAAPGTGPMPPDMGAMLSPTDVLAAGPRMRPGGAPDASAVPMPQISPFRPAMGGPADRRPQPPTPPMRPGGAPDAASVPNPPPRAQGIPNPRPRGTPYAPTFPALYGEQPPALAGGMSAEMGNAPPPPAPPSPPGPSPNSMMTALDIGQSRKMFEGPFGAGDLRPQSSPPPMPSSGSAEYGPMPPPPGPYFDMADPNPSRMGDLSAAMGDGQTIPRNVSIPKSPFEGSSGAGFTPAPPMPMPSQPAVSQGMRDQFDVAFSPGRSGQIMDLQSAFSRQNAPPTMNAQNGIDSVFGAPPAQAMPPNLAIPFAEVPRPNFDFAGPSPAAAANITSPMPMPQGASWGDMSNIGARFDDAAGPKGAMETSVVKPPPAAGPAQIDPYVQKGPPAPVPSPSPIAQAATMGLPDPPAPQTRRRNSLGQFIGGLLGGPIGALGGGLLGGGGAGFGFGGSAAFNPIMGSGGMAPSTGANGRPFNTTYRQGSAGNMQGTMWNRSNGGSVGYVTDPFTGAMIYSGSPTSF